MGDCYFFGRFSVDRTRARAFARDFARDRTASFVLPGPCLPSRQWLSRSTVRELTPRARSLSLAVLERRPRRARLRSPLWQTTCLSCCSSATAAWGRGAQRANAPTAPRSERASLTPLLLAAACCRALRYASLLSSRAQNAAESPPAALGVRTWRRTPNASPSPSPAAPSRPPPPAAAAGLWLSCHASTVVLAVWGRGTGDGVGRTVWEPVTPGPSPPPVAHAAPQDDTYTESYISTIGVDFVRAPCSGGLLSRNLGKRAARLSSSALAGALRSPPRRWWRPQPLGCPAGRWRFGGRGRRGGEGSRQAAADRPPASPRPRVCAC